MPWPLSPATRRLVGLMFLLSGALLVIGQVLRMYVMYTLYSESGPESVTSVQLVINLSMLVLGLLLLRYGWRERRGNDTVD
ncbi:hypothetical protein SAMN06265337_3014 [Hymenobacter gelipurpurascens]|uniref:Uncharacterized protein n=1 Tax=Hymenobacter gelipurpurascens TaxID=89968 RepID=A0A212UBP7_9BACT|nr:hypothetical protein [Hymenobacter gelipurpurascens]SNC75708.1 hypothetical protein SAMN06265337_3014 [Hymenobacter gelipurpurascens]